MLKNMRLVILFDMFLNSSFTRTKSYFSYKDPISDDVKSFLVCKFIWVSCSSSYIGKSSEIGSLSENKF